MRARWWGFWGALALVCGAGGLAVSYSIIPVYVSEGAVRLDEREFEAPTSRFLADVIRDAWLDVVSRKNLAETIQRPNLNLYAAERERLPVEDLIDRMKDHDLSLDLNDSELGVNFRYSDPAKAQATVALMLEQIVSALRKQGHHAGIASAASLPRSPESPDRRVFAGCGAGAGLLIGLVVSMFVWRPVWSGKMLACGLAGAAAVWAASLWFAPDRFVSKALLRVESELSGDSARGEIAEWRQMIDEEVWDRAQISELGQRPTVRLYAPERDEIGVLDSFRKAIRLECVGCDKPKQRGFATYKVSFESTDAEKAQKVVSAVITKVIDATLVHKRQIAAQAAAEAGGGVWPGITVTLLDPASLPEQPEAPRRWVLAIAGFTAGAVFGAGWLSRNR